MSCSFLPEAFVMFSSLALCPSPLCDHQTPVHPCSPAHVPFPWALQPTQRFSSSLLTEPKSLTFIVSADFIFWYMALFSWIISYLINQTLSHLKMSPPYKSTLKLWWLLNWTRQKETRFLWNWFTATFTPSFFYLYFLKYNVPSGHKLNELAFLLCNRRKRDF